jgi:hypothetical protein
MVRIIVFSIEVKYLGLWLAPSGARYNIYYRDGGLGKSRALASLYTRCSVMYPYV